jgi:hypothetical protein
MRCSRASLEVAKNLAWNKRSENVKLAKQRNGMVGTVIEWKKVQKGGRLRDWGESQDGLREPDEAGRLEHHEDLQVPDPVREAQAVAPRLFGRVSGQTVLPPGPKLDSKETGRTLAKNRISRAASPAEGVATAELWRDHF